MKSSTPEKHYFETRAQVPKTHRWKLEKVFKNIAEWEKTFRLTTKKVQPLLKYKGKLKSPVVILEYFQAASTVLRSVEKLYVYASHLSAVDLSNQHAQIITQKAQDLYAKFSQTISFQGPELIKLSDAVLKKMADAKNFHEFHRELKLIIVKKKHILSDPEEALLSLFSRVFTGPEDIFSALGDVDLNFGDVKDEQGKMLKLTSGNFTGFLENTDRRVRRDAFETLYKGYQSHIHTFSQTLNLCAKQHLVYSRVKKYRSCLEASLSSNLIDSRVYKTLIKETHRSLPPLHKYYAYRAKQLGLKKLGMWDLRVNLLNAKPLKFTYNEAVEICLQALKPLGSEYLKVLEDGLKNGWVDKFENKGKRSGAFSGGCYDSDAYILMNFTGTLNDVYTLIHESGHSMHSWLARHNQPYGLSDYALFVAEIASTVNERLLTEYLLKTYTGNKRKMVIAYEIDAIRATYFRQTQFAEFELNLHEKLEKDEPLTVQYFNQEYSRINSLYYGNSLEKDQYIQYEWSRIPHFYYNFYVYQYATGIAAAYYFADRIADPKTGSEAVRKYLEFLKSGGDDFPLLQLKRAGLDFVKPDLYRTVAKNLQKCLNLLEN